MKFEERTPIKELSLLKEGDIYFNVLSQRNVLIASIVKENGYLEVKAIEYDNGKYNTINIVSGMLAY